MNEKEEKFMIHMDFNKKINIQFEDMTSNDNSLEEYKIKDYKEIKIQKI